MKQPKKFFYVFVVFLTIFGLPMVSAQGSSDNIYFENDNFVLKVTGNQNVPQYQFWQPGQNQSEKYQVKFIRLFESIDQNNDGLYTKENETTVPDSNDALAAMQWEFSEILTEGNMTHFNITSIGRDFTIQFRNHYDAGATEIKFDIVMENYTFLSDDENVMLVLGFHLISSQNEMNREQNRVEFGNRAYMESEPQANTVNSSIQAGISNGKDNNNNMVYISFERFEGRLVHDPTIGFSAQTTTIPGYSLTWLAIVGLVGIISLVVGILRSKN